MSLNYSFSGKRMLITGGTRGIGRQLVQQFHDDGAHVYTVGKSVEGIAQLRKELPAVRAEVVDLADWKATRQMVEAFGRVDHLVNNAATHFPTDFMDITEETASMYFNVNVGAVINISQVVAKGMIDSGMPGSIVNISSVATCKFTPANSCYAATKAALEILTKSMTVELGPHNIRVNGIIPGIVNGGMVDVERLRPDLMQWAEDIKQSLVVKRFVEKKEVVDLVSFLLSPLSSMIVGQSIVIDGGFTII